jgi:WD40 repeat protein
VAVYARNAPIRLWDSLPTGMPREILRIPHRENVHTLSFRPDGHVLASASSDDIVLLSPVRLSDLLEETVGRLPRNLTPREWSYYVGAEPYRCTVPTLADCAAARRGAAEPAGK